MIDIINSVFERVKQERKMWQQGKPSIFGFPGSLITPHRSDYYEVYLLWDFVGGVAKLQKDLQNYFGFEIDKSFKQILLTPNRETVFLTVEKELSFVAPPSECGSLFYEQQEIEQVDLVICSIIWQGFPIYFKCGYGQKTNRLVFWDRLDYSIELY